MSEVSKDLLNVESPERPSAYGKMIDNLQALGNPHKQVDELEEAVKRFVSFVRGSVYDMNLGRLEYEGELQDRIQDLDQRLRHIDSKERHLHELIADADNNADWKSGAAWALDEMRRGIPRYEDEKS